ncbi:hypothetical protein H2O64_10780 [Kordia sp. YSTF-M3]|uniref:Uncharacterized protein n=1 Tax=Kordia aestuariivivens TaxID=2759037 RepID=A0ABR7Q9B7_9FLAO|nr:hypothetical protein [Kordia aestuariivivens]MBC8755159.1 hypothetical protein [Kordia aestuariivivens]
MRDLIIVIVIVVILAPFLFVNTRKNKKRAMSRKNKVFMKKHLEQKKEPKDD